MRECRLILLMLLALPLVCNAQYWFQYGVRAGSSTYYNSGAKVTIQTISNQNPRSGSIAFWVGENLNNGAFLQVGYLVTNQTGLYPSLCSPSGCSKEEYVTKGSTEWFYEYFDAGTGTSFLGAVGANDSAGANGTSHTYGFYSKGNYWYFFMDNKTLGEVNLGTNSSGSNDPVAFAEVANTSNQNTFIIPVAFSNLSFFKGGKFLQVPRGYSYIGYGVGSLSSLPNPYGVKEMGNLVNYFETGSGLPQPSNGQQLWELGFNLNILSKYGNISGINQYLAYHDVKITAPLAIYLSPNSRESFSNWTGYGSGAYSGTSPSHNITLFSNVTEIANWERQYLFNLTSPFGKATGYGWYEANSIVNYSLNTSDIYINDTSRWNFENWSNGATSISSNMILSRPYSIYAIWQKQYFLNATSPFGGVNGTGWYNQNSSATVSLSNLYHNISSTERLAFYSWSTGNRSAKISMAMDAPNKISAIFKNQSLVHFSGTDAYGSDIQGESFYIGNTSISRSAFLFNNHTYYLPKVYYKGTMLLLNKTVNISAPLELNFQLPIYDVQVKATDVFGIPVNVPMTLTFLNGTVLSGYSGQSGTFSVPDVPYGSAQVLAHYGGEAFSAQASQGNPARITIVSDLDLAIFAIIVIMGFGIYFVASHRIRHHNPRLQNK